jgi:predicted porin
MTRNLLGTTALVTVGVMAAASTAVAQTKVMPIQVSVGGYMGEFVSYTNQDDRGGAAFNQKLTQFDQWSDKEIHFNGRTTLDNGLTIGFRIELEGNTDATDQIDESYMFVEGRFGRLELGSLNNVQYRMGYNAPEAQTRPWSNEGNIFNVLANQTGSPAFDSMLGTTRSRFFDNDSEKINYYTPRFAGFQFGASYIPNSAQDRNGAPDPISTAYSRGWAAAANFVRTFGAFDVAVSGGYMTWQKADVAAGGNDDPSQYSAGLQLGYAGFKVGGSYGKIKDGRGGASGTNGAASTAGTAVTGIDGKAWDAGIMYTFGPAAVSVNYINGKNDDGNVVTGTGGGDDKFTMVSLAGKYTLGPGVSLEANLWTAKLESNGSGGLPNSDNKGTGGLVGIVLVF